MRNKQTTHRRADQSLELAVRCLGLGEKTLGARLELALEALLCCSKRDCGGGGGGGNSCRHCRRRADPTAILSFLQLVPLGMIARPVMVAMLVDTFGCVMTEWVARFVLFD